MILYYPTEFHFNTMKSFRIMGRRHFPPPPPPPLPPAQVPRKSSGRIGLRCYERLKVILLKLLLLNIGAVNN